MLYLCQSNVLQHSLLVLIRTPFLIGCEFIKAVSGFSCRLCNMFLQSGKDVNEHIQSKAHSSGYQVIISI